MRSLVVIIGSFCLSVTAPAQSLAEHAAAASGATIGTAAGKPISNAISTIFGNTDKAAQKAASPTTPSKTPAAKPEATGPVHVTTSGGAYGSASSGGSGGSDPGPAPSRHGGFSHRPPVAQAAVPDIPLPAIPEPARMEPTAEQFASIQVGATEQLLFDTLGQPESKVTIPDDEHLVVICQYWANGKQLGTVRLDNGQVVSVQARN